jgi:hypothetical protein
MKMDEERTKLEILVQHYRDLAEAREDIINNQQKLLVNFDRLLALTFELLRGQIPRIVPPGQE